MRNVDFTYFLDFSIKQAASHIHLKILRRLFRMQLSHIRRFRPRRMTSSPQPLVTDKQQKNHGACRGSLA